MKNSCSGKELFKKDDRTIIECATCGYIHVTPMYSAQELEEFYKHEYPESTPSYLMHEKVHTIKRWKQGGTVLDLGCWEGMQLEYFQRAGWQCVGIELNRRAASVAASKGIEVHNLSIDEFFSTFAQHKWDVINIAYVLEHIPRPIEFLVRIKRNVAHDGIIILEVPNDFSVIQAAYLHGKKDDPYWIALPDHLNYFNKASFEALLDKTGWRIIHGEVSFPMELFLLMGDDYRQTPAVGKQCFQKVLRMEERMRAYDPGLVSRLYSALYRAGIGRSLIVYAQPQ